MAAVCCESRDQLLPRSLLEFVPELVEFGLLKRGLEMLIDLEFREATALEVVSGHGAVHRDLLQDQVGHSLADIGPGFSRKAKYRGTRLLTEFDFVGHQNSPQAPLPERRNLEESYQLRNIDKRCCARSRETPVMVCCHTHDAAAFSRR